jgi:hypothetical protein
VARSITVTVVWVVTQCSLEFAVISEERTYTISTLNVVAGRRSETLVLIRITWRHIPEDGDLKQNTLLLCNLSSGIKMPHIT